MPGQMTELLVGFIITKNCVLQIPIIGDSAV